MYSPNESGSVKDPDLSQCPEGVAVVGMGCRWPGGISSPADLWDFLRKGESGYSDFVDRTLCIDGFYHPNPQRQGSIPTKGGNFLSGDPRKFDHSFFGIAPLEATTMDPTQRQLLEVTYEAFENAGETWESFSGSNTGVFVGNFNLDHSLMQARDPDLTMPYTTTGSSAAIMSNRLSYIFNLNGPSMTMDTACSSSMYALHVAVQSIRNGDCDAAIVAGSNLILTPDAQIATAQLGALSATSTCHTFDASADGYSRSEGIGVLYLKKVSDAIESNSPIRAVIRGTAINSNGKGSGITHPSSKAQEAVIKKAFKRAGGLSQSLVGYFECHGTGTQVGDPVEVAAVGRAFSASRNERRLLIGSIKSNLGHSESASGVAGVMKAVLCLENREIPPTIGVRNLNPAIDFETAHVEVVTKLTPWPPLPIRRACVNSFGFGGANGHCVLDSADQFVQEYARRRVNLHDRPVSSSCRGEIGSRTHYEEPISISIEDLEMDADQDQRFPNTDVICADGKSSQIPQKSESPAPQSTACYSLNDSQQSRSRMAESSDRYSTRSELDSQVSDDTSLMDSTLLEAHHLEMQFILPLSAHTQTSLQDNAERLMKVAGRYQLRNLIYTLCNRRSLFSSRGFLVLSSTDATGSLTWDDMVTGKASKTQNSKIGFVFTGQGVQSQRMGHQLVKKSPIFRNSIRHLDSVLCQLPNKPCWQLEEHFSKPESSNDVHKPEFSQTLCTALQIGLTDVLRAWGIAPTAVVGHSSGEIAAAYAAGAVTASESIILAYLRGISAESNIIDGRMLAVGLGVEAVAQYLIGHQAEIKIAAINSPSSVTLAGDTAAILAVQSLLEADKHFTKMLRTGSQAYHSHHMEKVGTSYEADIKRTLRDCQSVIERDAHRNPKIRWHSSAMPGESSKLSAPDASYWRHNMVSTVQFSQAIENLLAPEEEDLDMLIEIGPHPALASILNQTRATSPDTTDKALPVCLPTLRRDQDEVFCLLSLAGNLFIQNASVDMWAVNCSISASSLLGNSNVPKICIDLPPYKFQHGTILGHENRINRELRQRKTLRHDILGSRLVGASQDCPTWRNNLRKSDVPWLDDHKLLPETVFPTAGYIAMAVQAMEELSESLSIEHQPHSVSIKNLLIRSPLKLPEDDSVVETLLVMRTRDSIAASPSQRWMEFDISSFSHDQAKCIRHCSGMIAVDFPYVMPNRKLSEPKFAAPQEVEDWYKKFGQFGLSYGPCFRRLINLSGCENEQISVAEIDTSNINDPENGSPYAIHPGIIDSCLQLTLISAHSTQYNSFRKAFVPVSIGSITIIPLKSFAPELSVKCVATGRFEGMRAVRGDCELFFSAEHQLLQMEDIQAIVFSAQRNDQVDRDPEREPYFHMDWKFDIDHLTNAEAQSIFPAVLSVEKMAHFYDKAEILVDCITLNISELQTAFDYQNLPLHLQGFMDWVARRTELITIQNSALTSEQIWSRRIRDKTIEDLLKELGILIEIQMLQRLYRSIEGIFSVEVSALQLAVEDNLLDEVYKSGLVLSAGRDQFINLLDLIAHKKPMMKVIEIGAGTGGATENALDVLDGRGVFSRYRKYYFTDISTSFFATAQKRFASYRNLVFERLDISLDPRAQGFASDFDVVLAFQCLHATPDIAATVRNLRQLVQPGSYLLMIEGTRHLNFVSLLFGMFPDFWSGIEDGRTDNAFITREQWNSILLQNGFSGLEIVLEDIPEPYSFTSTLFSRAVETYVSPFTVSPSQRQSVTLVYLEKQDPLTDILSSRLLDQGIETATVPLFDVYRHAVGRVICLTDLGNYVLKAESDKAFLYVKYLIDQASDLTWVTKHRNDSAESSCSALAQGLLSCVAIEKPQMRYQVIDFEEETTDIAGNLCDLILEKTRDLLSTKTQIDNHYIFRDNKLYVGRISPSYGMNQNFRDKLHLSLRTELLSLDNLPMARLDFANPGLLDSFFFRETEFAEEDFTAETVEIETRAIGLNFYDVTVATGRFNSKFSSLNCAGVVRKIGSSVRSLKINDRVWGLVLSNFDTRIRGPEMHFQKLDENESFTTMGSIAVPYATAFYALLDLSRLSKDMTVLIQAGASSLGMAAIRIAQHVGADIFVTVSTSEKMRTMREDFQIPENRIISSTFETLRAVVMRNTQNIGVDVVLCTASGDDLHELSTLVAPFGNFVEVGRTDVHGHNTMSMDFFRKNASFSSFDTALLFQQKPKLGARILRDIRRLTREGGLKIDDAAHKFDVSKIDKAMLYFSQRKRIGRVAISYENPKAMLRSTPPYQKTRLDPDGCYILVGCLGGLGLSLSKLLARLGARKLCFMSRSGVSSSEASITIDNLRKRGIHVEICQGDVSKRTDASRIIKFASQIGSIKGVIHAALELQDISFEKISSSTFRNAIKAKVDGTINLHELTSGLALDFFLMTSSIINLVGSATQSAYAAAIAFQDQFARWRRSQGLSAVAFAFNLVLGAGTAANQPEIIASQRRNAMYTLKLNEFLELAEAALLPQHGLGRSDTEVCSATPDADLTVGLEPSKILHQVQDDLQSNYHWPGDPRLARIVQAVDNLKRARDTASSRSAAAKSTDEEIIGELQSLPKDKIESVVSRLIVQRLSRLLFIAVEDVSPDSSLSEYGMDSMIAAELRNWLFKTFKLDIGFLELLDQTLNVTDVVSRAVDQVIQSQ